MLLLELHNSLKHLNMGNIIGIGDGRYNDGLCLNMTVQLLCSMFHNKMTEISYYQVVESKEMYVTQ